MSAKDFTLETAQLMKQAGFEKVSFSLESTSAEVLKQMGRANNVDTSDILRMAEIVDKAGFKRMFTDIHFIIGLPYQALEDMLDTLFLALRLGFWAHPQRLTPIPGTVDFKRLGLDGVDLADLHYKKYVAPNDGKFTGDDLELIWKIAWSFNYGRNYANGYNLFADDSKVGQIFRQMIAEREKTNA